MFYLHCGNSDWCELFFPLAFLANVYKYYTHIVLVRFFHHFVVVVFLHFAFRFWNSILWFIEACTVYRHLCVCLCVFIRIRFFLFVGHSSADIFYGHMPTQQNVAISIALKCMNSSRKYLRHWIVRWLIHEFINLMQWLCWMHLENWVSSGQKHSSVFFVCFFFNPIKFAWPEKWVLLDKLKSDTRSYTHKSSSFHPISVK